MSQTILQQIFNLQQRYNNKMMEYDDAMTEHMANVQQYKLICDTSKFKHCAGENEQCQVNGQKTVRYGPVESGSFIKVGDSKYCRPFPGNADCKSAGGNCAPADNEDICKSRCNESTCIGYSYDKHRKWCYKCEDLSNIGNHGNWVTQRRIENKSQPTNSSYAYKNTSSNIACNNQTFGDPAPGDYKTCSTQTMCVTPDEIQTTNLDTSKGKVNQKIKELKEINDLILEKVKELLKYRDEWTEDYSNQESYLLRKMEQVNMQREQLEKISIPVAESTVGQYEDSSQQISQLITQYALLGGALTLTGIAFYLILRKGSGKSGMPSRPGAFKIPMTN